MNIREDIRLEEEFKNTNIPDELPVLAIRGGVTFPGVITPLIISTARASKLIDDALAGNKLIVSVSQKKQEIEEAGPEHLHQVGTVSYILKMLRFPDNTIRILLQGVKRAQINEYTQTEPYLKAKITQVSEPDKKDISTEASVRNIMNM
ncbi:MAG: LON peptidase substrate-binding domain-containing protein, partial [Ignavibacteria bacterium]|nr:LON peptidase substrate-binding domain-containing protein [Ignavibacteria bacterium]